MRVGKCILGTVIALGLSANAFSQPSVSEPMALMMLVGCVEADGAEGFQLVSATSPQVVDDRLPESPGPEAVLGTGQVELIGTLDEFGVAQHAGHKVWVKGLYLENGADTKLNLVSLLTLADACQ